MRPASVWVTGPDAHYMALRADVEVEDRGTINPYITAYCVVHRAWCSGRASVATCRSGSRHGFTDVLSNTDRSRRSSS